MSANPARPSTQTLAQPAPQTAQQQASSHSSISLPTLLVAAVSSVGAAIITSHFLGQSGTLVTTAATPVLVALLREWLQRPAERITKAPAAAARAVVARRPSHAGPDAHWQPPGDAVGLGAPGDERPGPAPEPPPPLEPWKRPPRTTEPPVQPAEPISGSYDPYGATADAAGGALGAESEHPRVAPGELSPYRVHRRRRRRRRRPRLRLAILTGLLAFVICIAVLTIPELIAGHAVSSDRGTSLWGGKPSSSRKSHNGAQTTSTPSTTPSSTTPTSPSQSTTPTTTPTTPSQTTPSQTTPSQTTPSQTTPSAPSVGSGAPVP